jgi:hypothetical protein
VFKKQVKSQVKVQAKSKRVQEREMRRNQNTKMKIFTTLKLIWRSHRRATNVKLQ